MKNIFKQTIAAAVALVSVAGFTACESGNGDDLTSERDERLKSAVQTFVKKTVVPTYKSLADATIELQSSCEAILEAYDAGNLTANLIKTAGDDWKNARQYWEWSEAFLFGAATDYNIDPHIDTWPLDRVALESTILNNAQTLAAIEANPDLVSSFGVGLLGFHALEYMLFENGGPHAAATLSRAQLVYLVAVANDLCNQCCRLEAAWAGFDNISAEKQTILEEVELDEVKPYGTYMLEAGQAGSIYKTYTEAAEEIMQGCIDIATEVGSQKIGRPANGTSEEDISYIESPYSYNSRQDFVDNIISIRNAYTGSNPGDASVSDYIKSVNSALDTELRSVIDETIAKIQACPAEFVNTRTDQRWKDAATYCNVNLVNALTKAQTALTDN